MKTVVVLGLLSLLLLVRLPGAIVAAEPWDIKATLSRMMSEARSNTPFQTPSEEQLRDADPQRVLDFLAPYEKDSSWLVRRLALSQAVRVATIHPESQIRQQVVERLVEATLSRSVPGAREWLRRFRASEYNDRSKDLIREALARVNRGVVGGDRAVWLCGSANIRDQLPRLKGLLIDEIQYQAEAKRSGDKKWYLTTGWAARLARARMGVEEDIERCIELAEAEQDADERVLRILPQIGTIRRPRAVEYLRRYLDSDERLAPVKPTGLGGLYASRVMHIFAESLEDYPVKQKAARNYTEEEIQICREWMGVRANWKIIR